MAKRKADDVVGLMVRLREDLRRALENAADEEGRSLNSEINLRLTGSFKPPSDKTRFEMIADALGREMDRTKEVRQKLEAEKLALMNDRERNFIKEMQEQARQLNEGLRAQIEKLIEAERYYRRLAAGLEGRTVTEQEDRRRAMEIEARPDNWPPKTGE